MTPFELRSLCHSNTIPLEFAAAFDGLSEADRKQLSKTARGSLPKPGRPSVGEPGCRPMQAVWRGLLCWRVVAGARPSESKATDFTN